MIDSLCAVAVRFCEPSRTLTKDDMLTIGDEFASQAKAAHIKQIHGENFRLGLDVLKTSLLLTLYQCTRQSPLKSWNMAGETIRLAYNLNLDKIDPLGEEGQHSHEQWIGLAGLSDAETEDCRHVFWSIWKLDIFYSGLCGRPFGVDSQAIQTYLPSSSYQDLISNNIPSIQRHYLVTDIAKITRDVWKLDLNSIVDVQRFYFIANMLVRSASELRRLNLANNDVNHRMLIFETSLASILASLPNALQHLEAGVCTDLQMAKDRILAESVLLIEL